MGFGLASPDHLHLRLRALGAIIAVGLSGLVAAVARSISMRSSSR